VKLLTIEETIKITRGKHIAGKLSRKLPAISIDTRTMKKGQTFIPIVGENHNGHTFISAALKKGATCIFCEHRYLPAARKELNKNKNYIAGKIAVIGVANSRLALGAVARWRRGQFQKLKVIAITGSNGKTTTKEIIAALLKKKYKIHKTKGNSNNEIGVPLSILRMPENTDIFVAELGINHFHELEYLSKVIHPHVTVITNVGPTHLEFLRDIQGVARAKAEIIPFTRELLITSAADRFSHFFTSQAFCPTRVVDNEEDSIFDKIQYRDEKGWKVQYRGHWMEIKMLGMYNLINIQMAICVAEHFKIPVKTIREVIAKQRPVEGRTKLIAADGVKILSDTYNANPAAVAEAMSLLAELAQSNRKIAVLGSMKELGIKAQQLHREIGSVVEELEFDALFTIGAEAADIKKGITESHIVVKHARREKDLIDALKKYIEPGDYVLIKGSRIMEMENIVNALIKTKGK